jgi:hypothetical protein
MQSKPLSSLSSHDENASKNTASTYTSSATHLQDRSARLDIIQANDWSGWQNGYGRERTLAVALVGQLDKA